MTNSGRSDGSAGEGEQSEEGHGSAVLYDAVLRWIHEGRRAAAPVRMSPRPWLPLDEAVLLVLASSKIEVELQEFGERGILFLTDATWKELCAFLCDAGSEGRLRLRGRRNSSDDPAGEME